MKNSLVSVVIPAFNNARYLYEAITSVKNQSYPEIEIIVVDDGSNDNTKDVVAGLDARYTYQEQLGAPAARNRGAELAKGELLAFLDADDVWYSDKLQLQFEALERAPELDMIFGHLEEFISPDCEAAGVRRVKEYVPGYVQGTLLIKEESFWKVGGFADQERDAQFIDWYIQAQKRGLQAKLLSDVVLRRRLHQLSEGVRPRLSPSTSRVNIPVFKATVDLVR
ncbi:MAG TPA: glycosyltransferase family A protein [Planktothrix sp.]|jgi:glycosyltransferase involved in cell wall biosynthesis